MGNILPVIFYFVNSFKQFIYLLLLCGIIILQKLREAKKIPAINRPFLFEGIPLYIEKIDVSLNSEEITITVLVKGNKRLDLRYIIPREQTDDSKALRDKFEELSVLFGKDRSST